MAHKQSFRPIGIGSAVVARRGNDKIGKYAGLGLDPAAMLLDNDVMCHREAEPLTMNTVDIVYRYADTQDIPARPVPSDGNAALLRLNDGNRDFSANSILHQIEGIAATCLPHHDHQHARGARTRNDLC